MKGGRLLGWTNLLLGGVLMLAVWVLVVLVASRPALRRVFDLSPNARLSIDPVSVALLSDLAGQKRQVEFHVFFQPLDPNQAPQDPLQRQHWSILRSLQGLTVDLLTSFKNSARGAVHIVYHSQENLAAYREATTRYGVGEGDWVVVEVQSEGAPPRNKRLSIAGDMAMIEFPSSSAQQTGMPQTGLPILKDFKGEAAVSSAIKSLLVQGTPILYVVKDYQDGQNLLANTGDGYGLLLHALEAEGFTVRTFELGKGIPDDATAVALIEPRRELAAPHAQSLLAYVRRGGRLFLNYSYVNLVDWNPDGGELGKALGFQIGPDPIFHLIANPSNPNAPGLDRNREVEKLPLQCNPSHPVTRPIAISKRYLELAAAREIRLQKDVQDVRRDTVLATGPYAWVAARAEDRQSFARPADDRQLRPYDVAVAIDVDGKDQAGEKLTGHVFVLSGIAINNVGMPVNRDLGLNIFQWFAERNEQVTVRGERYEAKRFQFGLEQLEVVRWFVIAGVPLAFLLCGILVAWRRSRN